MRSSALYVYGLVRATEAPSLGWIGVEHDGAPGHVRTIRADGVAALVSPWDARRRVAPFRRNLDAHHRVIHEVLRTTTVVPMTFGHVADNEAEVVEYLQDAAAEIASELDRLEGLVEMGLKVRWDVDNVVKYMVDRDPELAAFRSQIFERPYPPMPAEKIELGRMFEERLRMERAALTEALVTALDARVVDVEIGPAHGDKTVADLAFLVRRDALSAFQDRVREIAATWPGEYVFAPSGPWAPFHFVELQLTPSETGGAACGC